MKMPKPSAEGVSALQIRGIENSSMIFGLNVPAPPTTPLLFLWRWTLAVPAAPPGRSRGRRGLHLEHHGWFPTCVCVRVCVRERVFVCV